MIVSAERGRKRPSRQSDLSVLFFSRIWFSAHGGRRIPRRPRNVVERGEIFYAYAPCPPSGHEGEGTHSPGQQYERTGLGHRASIADENIGGRGRPCDKARLPGRRRIGGTIVALRP